MGIRKYYREFIIYFIIILSVNLYIYRYIIAFLMEIFIKVNTNINTVIELMMVRFTYSSCYYAIAVVILAVHMNDDCCIAFTPIVVSQQRPTTSSLWMVRIAYIQTRQIILRRILI